MNSTAGTANLLQTGSSGAQHVSNVFSVSGHEFIRGWLALSWSLAKTGYVVYWRGLCPPTDGERGLAGAREGATAVISLRFGYAGRSDTVRGQTCSWASRSMTHRRMSVW